VGASDALQLSRLSKIFTLMELTNVYSEMISEHHFTSWTSQLSVKLNAKDVRKDDLIQQFGQCLSVDCRNKDNEAVNYVSC